MALSFEPQKLSVWPFAVNPRMRKKRVSKISKLGGGEILKNVWIYTNH